MTKAVITADLHLKRKPGLWSGRAEITGDDEYALSQIIDYTLEHDADLYILGDMFDSVSNIPRPMVIMKEQLLRLGPDKIVRYIQGNHEMITGAAHEQRPWLDIFPGTEDINAVAFDFLGKRAYALEYFPLAYAPLALSSIPADTQVLFLHGTIDTVTEFNYHFEESMLPETIKYVFAGDWHEHFDISLESGAKLYYPGSTYLCSAAESPEKFFLTVDMIDNALVIESVPLKGRNITKLSTLRQQGKLEVLSDDTLPEALQRPVVIIDEPCSPDEYQLLSSQAHLYTLGKASAKVEQTTVIADTLSNEEILEQYIDKEKHGDEFAFVLDVIDNPVADAIDRLKEKLGMCIEG